VVEEKLELQQLQHHLVLAAVAVDNTALLVKQDLKV
jgi:hypothetical protein